MPDSFERVARNFVHRLPDRGTLSKSDIYAILDAGFLCHVGFEVDGQPFVIPTLYARCGEKLFLHGSAASRMIRQGEKGVPICVCVTHVDGLVVARSAFHHSVNYRSAVLFGTATIIEDQGRKLEALRLFTNWVVQDRWEELRDSTEQELKATSVLEVTIEHASGKVRSGPPADAPEDLELPVWAGVLPMRTVFGEAVPDAHNKGDVSTFDFRRVQRLGRPECSLPSNARQP